VSQVLSHPRLLQALGLHPHSPLATVVNELMPFAQQQLANGTPQVIRGHVRPWMHAQLGGPRGALHCLAVAPHPCQPYTPRHTTHTTQAALSELSARIRPNLLFLKAALETRHRLSRGPTPLERLDFFTKLARWVLSCFESCALSWSEPALGCFRPQHRTQHSTHSTAHGSAQHRAA
jgi:hypothetical protein